MGCGGSKQVDAAEKHQPQAPALPAVPLTQDQRVSEIHEEHKKQHLNQNIVHEEVNRKVTDVYDIAGAELGTGISGTVRVCTHKATKIQYALKTLQLHQIRSDPEAMMQLKDEIGILKSLDHPHIVRLEEVYETPDHMFLILELCTGGEMLDRLNSQRGFRYSEKIANGYIKTMVNSIRYVHEHNITHRDLKLENFLLQDQTDEADLKLIDFGLSRHFKKAEKMNVPVGTPYYVAPEVLNGNYDEKVGRSPSPLAPLFAHTHPPPQCDLWSLGVITYMLLSGTPPFAGNGENEILSRVKKGSYDLNISKFDKVSAHAKDFIKKLLVMDPKKRMSAKQAQEHVWLHDFDLADEPLDIGIVGSLRGFHQHSAMKKLVCEVLAYTLMPEQIHDLRKEFEKIDVSGTGEFTIEEFRDALAKSQHVSVEECDQIFLDMDIEHSGKIHWHEFIAATLNKCEYDDRNLKLAFDRLDFDHQGFITKENLMDIIGSDSSEAEIQSMFGEVTTGSRITYEDFCKIMKNNGPSGPPRHDSMSVPSPGRRLSVSAVPLKIDSAGRIDTTSCGEANKDKHQVRNEIHMKIHAAAEERARTAESEVRSKS